MIHDFKDKEAFRMWLANHHDRAGGQELFIYKKKYHTLGISYEEAVQAAVAYGWIDGITHSYDDIKFTQYFARRLKKSNWSISNLNRVKYLFEKGEMTPAGWRYVPMELLKNLDILEAYAQNERLKPVAMPPMIKEGLVTQDLLQLYYARPPGEQRRWILYIMDCKQEKTKLRRLEKLYDMLRTGKKYV